MLVGGVYGIFRFANRNPPAIGNENGPSGVRGWLLFLVTGFIFLWPLIGAGRINSDIIAAESRYPDLAAQSQWETLKTTVWWCFFAKCCLSIYAGIGLARGRTVGVVTRAKIVLWIIGPIDALVMGLIVPITVFGRIESGATIFWSVVISALAAAFWTAYLARSRRVNATYGLPTQL